MAQPQRWSIILHGGCSNSCPEVKTQLAIRQNLASVLDVAVTALKSGATAREVVCQAVAALEDCPLYNSGKGSASTLEGDYELEAGVVDGHSGGYGAVACLKTTKNPVLAANAILLRGGHSMLVDDAADDMAHKVGFEKVPNIYFETASRRAYWESQFKRIERRIELESGTVGAVALDIHGHIAAAGSSGGISAKDKGRVGDTAILGAGLFANNKIGIACSGAGDEIFRRLLATKVADKYSHSLDLDKSAQTAVAEFALTGKPGAIIALDNQGKFSVQSAARLFSTASASSEDQFSAGQALTTFPILPQHEFFRNHQIVAGLSRFPTTRGHSLVNLVQTVTGLFSLDRESFVQAMLNTKQHANRLGDFYKVERCALVTEGNSSISILPLHGLGKSWEPITASEKEFNESYPGYISSKDGPTMESTRLDEIAAGIRGETGLVAPFNYHFDGNESDDNLFAKLVRGEIPQYRVWEDEGHVAFLTPFANTPGFTVLVPRKHLTSDIFGIEDASFTSLMHATYTVAGSLIKAFGVEQCGMIFEGFEIDYAHVKLIPIHSRKGDISTTISTPFEEKYQGSVSSLNGPFSQNQEALVLDASALR